MQAVSRAMQKFPKSKIGLNFEVGEVTMIVRFTISGLKLLLGWVRNGYGSVYQASTRRPSVNPGLATGGGVIYPRFEHV